MHVTDEQKPAALAALYNHSSQQGLGFLQGMTPPMTAVEAVSLLEKQTYFDYVRGRVMKVDFRTNDLDFRLYDRDNGQGAGERAIREALSS